MANFELTFGDLLNLKRFNRDQQVKREDELRKRQQDQIDAAKWTIGKLMDSYNSPSSGLAMKGLVRDQMHSLYNSLPRPLRDTLEPYIRHSPISEEAQKLHRFLEFNPPPPEPSFQDEITESVGEGGARKFTGRPVLKDPAKYASDYFRYSDWSNQRDSVVFGKTRSPETFLSLPDGGAAIRNKEGRVVTYSSDQLQLKDISEKLGVTPAEIIANQGYLPGQRYTKVVGDQLVEFQVDNAAIPGIPPIKHREIGRQAAPTVPREPLPPQLDSFMTAYVANDTDNKPYGPLVKRINKFIEDEKKGKLPIGTVDAELRAVFGASHSYIIRTRSEKVPGKYFYLFDKDAQYSLGVVRGVPAGIVKDPASGRDTVIYMDENGTFYDGANTPLGKYEDVVRIFGAIKELTNG